MSIIMVPTLGWEKTNELIYIKCFERCVVHLCQYLPPLLLLSGNKICTIKLFLSVGTEIYLRPAQLNQSKTSRILPCWLLSNIFFQISCWVQIRKHLHIYYFYSEWMRKIIAQGCVTCPWAVVRSLTRETSAPWDHAGLTQVNASLVVKLVDVHWPCSSQNQHLPAMEVTGVRRCWPARVLWGRRPQWMVSPLANTVGNGFKHGEEAAMEIQGLWPRSGSLWSGPSWRQLLANQDSSPQCFICQLLESRHRGPTHRRCSINICWIHKRTMSNINKIYLVLKG